jgi:glycosyltransferase involved in cell wall biosynthesis
MELELRAEHSGFARAVERLPLGVTVARFADGLGRDAARARLGLEGPTVLCVRRLVARMGLDLLVTAFATVLDRHPGAVLAIAGRGYQRGALERRVRQLGIAPAVRFLGFVPDEELPLWFRAADLFVLPSVSLEGFGMVTLEALAAGTPVLATPIGASPEVLGPLGDRHLAAAATAGALASAVDAWLFEPATDADRERFAAYAREEFGAAAVAKRLEGLLAEARRR